MNVLHMTLGKHPTRNTLYKKYFLDISIILYVGLFILILTSYFDTFEYLSEITSRYEHLEIDELIFCIAAMLLAACVIVFIRTREIYLEINKRMDSIKKFEKEKKVYMEDINEAAAMLIQTDQEQKKLLQIFENELSPPIIRIRNLLKQYKQDNNEDGVINMEQSERIEHCTEKLEQIISLTTENAKTLENRIGWHMELRNNL